MLNKQPDRFELLLKASENLLQKVSDQQQTIENHENRIVYLEKHMTVDSRKRLNIKRRAEQHVTKILGGKDSLRYKTEYRQTISHLWHDYWNAFGVTTYHDTPAVMYEAALEFIDNWRPLKLAGLEPPPEKKNA